MSDQNSTVILQVKLDEGATEKQLADLVLKIEGTRKAQLDLNAARKAGTVADDEFAQQTVKLKAELKGQQTEFTALQKNLDLYRTATGELGDTYKGTQAQLSLAQRQYQELQGSQNNSTESTKALSTTIEGLRATLAKTDEQQGLFVRNIGNYPKGESLEPLIQQLIHLQEVQKQLPPTSAAAVEAQKQIGFQMSKLNESAASAGLSQTALTNKLQDYGERIRPATSELAKLTIAQDEAARSAGKESAEFAKIGFQIGAARKEVAKVPPELAKIPSTAETATKALGDTATKGMGLFGDQTDRVTGLLNKFKTGGDLVKKGLESFKGAGESGSLGLKAIASGIALTGIGLFVIAISAVVAYFTQTAEGGRILKGVLGGLGATIQVVTDLVTGLGKGIVEAVSNPKQAVADFVQFFEDQVSNRFKAFGKILDAIKRGNLYDLTNSVAQLATGVVDVNGKLAKMGQSLKAAYDLGSSFAEREKELTIARRELEIDEVKQQSRVAVLIRLSKDRTLSSKEQLANLKEAGRVEAELTKNNIALQEKELQLTKDKITAAGKGKGAGELKAQLAEQQKSIAQSLAAQDEVNAKIKTRESIFIQAQRTAAAAAAKQRAKDAVAAKQTENELALLEVAKGSAAELALKKQAIDLAADFEIAGEKKTAEQVKLIRAKAEGDKLDLQLAFEAKALEEAKKRTAATLAESNREYELAQQNLENYLNTQRAALESDFAEKKISQNTYQKQLNAIEKAGFAAALVNADDYGKDKAKILKADADREIREAERVKNEKKKIEDTKQAIQDAAFQAAATTSDLVIGLYGEESTAGKEALAIKKTLALAEIAISTQKQLIANAEAGTKISAEAPPYTVPLGIAYTVATDALAIASAAAAAAKILGFRDGGVLVGPAHEQGGIPFTVGGRPGFEAEGGEVILTRGVWQNPLLRPLASTLNVLGGGAPLLPRAHMAVGGVASAQTAGLLRGDIPVVDPKALGQAVAAALRKNPAVNRWVDFKEAEARNSFTDSKSSS